MYVYYYVWYGVIWQQVQFFHFIYVQHAAVRLKSVCAVSEYIMIYI